jgi:hypothetical protein
MALALTLGGRAGEAVPRRRRRVIAAGALVPVVLLTTGLTVESQDRGISASFSATAEVNVGDATGTGDISITAVDMGDEVIASDEYGLVLEVGTDAMPLPGQAEPVMEATWPSFSGEAPSGPHTARYIGGGIVLAVLIVLALLLERRSPSRRDARGRPVTYDSTSLPRTSPRHSPVSRPRDSMNSLNRSMSPWTRRFRTPSLSPISSMAPSGS